jgi:D-arabinose 1-dehydrogenase-like Zn-dependent alcohol dehydrogenase
LRSRIWTHVLPRPLFFTRLAERHYALRWKTGAPYSGLAAGGAPSSVACSSEVLSAKLTVVKAATRRCFQTRWPPQQARACGLAVALKPATVRIKPRGKGIMATATVEVTSMKVAQIAEPRGDFQIVERDIPEPGAGQVRIKVQACGVCHSDLFTKEGAWPGIQYPRVPGHEIAGIIDAVGAGVSQWKKGRRTGVGWHGGQDGTCLQCRRGDFRNCLNLKIPGISYDGGYAQYMVAPVEALAAIPDTLSDAEAAPLLCAGITTFNALRHGGAMPGDLVAVQGIGGLGHLGIQFARKFGYTVAAIGRGAENARLAEKLGASVYIDSKSTNAAEALQKMGGAKLILATAPSAKAMSQLIDGLGANGKLMVVGASLDPIEVTPVQLITRTRTIEGWASGTPTDSEDTMRFAELTGVRAMIETYPLEMAGEAYARMLSGNAQFRVVLTM